MHKSQCERSLVECAGLFSLAWSYVSFCDKGTAANVIS